MINFPQHDPNTAFVAALTEALAERGIPLRLRSALAPDAPGTDIGPGCTRPMPPRPPQPPAFALLACLAASTSAGKAVRPDAF